MNCIFCGSINTVKNGYLEGNSSKVQRRRCKDCKKEFSGQGAPKILLFDIETSHIIFRLWDTGDQYVRPDQIVKDWYVLCWSAKWLFDDKVLSDSISSSDSIKGNDEKVCKSIHKLLSQADVVITQNGDKFDIRKLQWKFMKYGFPPNNKYHSIDTLKKSRQIASPTSHGLNFVAQSLGFGQKSPMVEGDWIRAEAGDKKAIEKMSKYCENDIYLLEDWYLVLRGWMKTHPNLAPYVEMYREIEPDENICPRCLHTLHDTVFNRKWYSLATGKKYKAGGCTHCGTQLRRSYKRGEKL